MTLLKLSLALLCAAVLAACTTTTTNTTGTQGAPGGTATRASTDTNDADRRASVRMELAGLHYGRGQFELALDEIKLALLAKPEFGPAFSLRGLVYASMGEEALADASFDRALQINPRDADTLHNRGWFLCQRNRFVDADRYFEQALALPQYRETQRTYLAQGVCHARAGQLDEAERKLNRAYELDPGNPTTALNLSEVLYRRGEYERARFYVRRVNQREELSNVQSLWLALRIENRLGNRGGVEDIGRQMRIRFPQSAETLAFERGRLDE
jgi:type IV pilus assembly protein PilF